MYVRELIAAAPTAEALLALTGDELERLLLKFIRAASDDQLRRMVTRDGILTELFGPSGRYDIARRDAVTKAMSRAWKSLEAADLIEEPDSTNGKNGYRVVSAKGRVVNTDVDMAKVKVRAWLTADLLHPVLRGSCLNAFKAADYDTAVFEAFKAVEAAVRKTGEFSASDFGVALMKKAFDPTNGPLLDPDASVGRREARRQLFVGAMGELRNPKAHGDPTISDPQLAIEEIMTASLLLRIVGA